MKRLVVLAAAMAAIAAVSVAAQECGAGKDPLVDFAGKSGIVHLDLGAGLGLALDSTKWKSGYTWDYSNALGSSSGTSRASYDLTSGLGFAWTIRAEPSVEIRAVKGLSVSLPITFSQFYPSEFTQERKLDAGRYWSDDGGTTRYTSWKEEESDVDAAVTYFAVGVMVNYRVF